jgi:magnesium-transporting ATPase (P-type)
MDKDAQLERIDSNARPYAIFFGYLGCCLAVSVFIVMKMFERAEALYTSAPSQLPAKRHVIVFTTLAACSLLSTWGYMFQYFQWSYDNWLAVRSQHDLDPSVRHWGLWLKETSLFKEAWLSVVIGHNRYWWSHQIFYFAACLGLHLEWKGTATHQACVAGTDESRCPQRNQLYMGVYAPWADRSN